MSCGVGHRCISDPALLWQWYRPAATAPIGPLPWEPPYAEGAAQEKGKNTKKVKKIKKNKFFSSTIPVMNVYEYILRIVRYTNIESNTLIAAMISLTSYIHRNKISLCYNNIH